MKIRFLPLLLILCSLAISAGAQMAPVSYQDRVAAYIASYKNLAIQEQLRSGVPAAITLGQGILETSAGNSELATIANNHFGIKCKSTWQGETYTYTDDRPDECFRRYGNPLESYRDHSDYLLTGPRYKNCFAREATDYKGWATNLRKCGYATNPKYAFILIKIIEDFGLQEHTLTAQKIAKNNPPARNIFASAAATPPPAYIGEIIPQDAAPDSPRVKLPKPIYGELQYQNGTKGFYAHKGDLLLEYAVQYGIRYAKLLDLNKLPDAPLREDMFVALEKKGTNTATTPPARLDAPPTTAEAPEVAAAAEETEHPAITREAAREAQDNFIPTTTLGETGTLAAAPTAAEDNEEDGETEVPETPAAAPAKPEAVAAAPAKPAPAPEPTDPFERMKARLDKIVFEDDNNSVKAAPVKSAEAAAKPTAATTAAASAAAQSDIIAPATGKIHVVKGGETAYGIAKQYGLNVQELMNLNGITNFSSIRTGQKLKVK